MPLTLVLTLLFLVLFQSAAISQIEGSRFGGGSTCIVIMNDDTFYVATDSRKNVLINDIISERKKVDKIYFEKGIFWASTGTTTIENQYGIEIFNSDTIMSELINQMDNFDSVVLKFAIATSNKINAVYKRLSAIDKSSLDKKSINQPFIACAVICNRGDTLKFCAVEIVFDKMYNIFRYNRKPKTESFNYYLSGYTKSVVSEFNKNPNALIEENMVEGLARLINLEAINNPDHVGGPIDVIKIYRGGFILYSDITAK